MAKLLLRVEARAELDHVGPEAVDALAQVAVQMPDGGVGFV
jgi:hypothetical protein